MRHAQRNTTHHMGEWGIMRHAQPVKLESGVSWGTHSLSNWRVGYHETRTTKHDPSHGRVGVS